MVRLRSKLLEHTRVSIGLFIGFSLVVLLVVGVFVGRVLVKAWQIDQSRPEFREGVRVDVRQVGSVRQELLSLAVPADVGYAETGDGCHVASGALLLCSEKIRRVLSTIDAPVCGDPAEDVVLRSLPANRLPKRRLADTSAFWLERQGNGSNPGAGGPNEGVIVTRSAAGVIQITEGSPWPSGFLVNCSRDRRTYSLRTLMPDVLVGGSKYGELARVEFRLGTCMDRRHWPKIEALVDLIWSLDDYRSRGT